MADEKVVDIGNLADQYRERIMRRDLLMAVLARIDVQLISPLMFGLERKDQREITAVKMMIGGEIAREEKKLSAVIEETIRQRQPMTTASSQRAIAADTSGIRSNSILSNVRVAILTIGGGRQGASDQPGHGCAGRRRAHIAATTFSSKPHATGFSVENAGSALTPS